MGNAILKLNKKGQNTLEVVVAVIIVTLLLGGITNLWLWANRQLVLRQIAYNEGRVAAGTAVDNYHLQWPTFYRPEALGEEKVLLYNGGRQ